jgi:hAT family C-terminal dimerisation region
MGGDENSIFILTSQLRKYWLNKTPYDLSYDIERDTPIMWWLTCYEKPPYLQTIALKLFSIVPHSANCERIFSVLRWFYGQRRTRLDPSRISKMAKIHSYYITNAKNQLEYYGNLLSDDKIQDQVLYATQNLTNLNEIQEEILFDDDFIIEDNESQYAKVLVDEEELNWVLEIEVCVDLSNQIFNSNNNISYIENEMEQINENFIGNINYNLTDVVDRALEDFEFE